MEIIRQTLDDGNIVKINIGTELNDGGTNVSGSIELDIENQSHFVELINTIFDEGVSKVIVNMENISYIDSSGLWALFEGHKKAAQRDGKMVLLKPAKDVKRVLDITKMSAKMAIVDNEDDAISTLKA